MSGTKAGGLKAAETNKLRYGKDFYARMGAKGGAQGHTGGFYQNPELAKIAGAKGGRISKRKPTSKTMVYEAEHHKDSSRNFLSRFLRRSR